jgi:chaperonin cofactor prefoldin
MTAPSETALVRELRAHIHELERQNTDLKQQVEELRAAVAALLAPASSERGLVF